MPKLFSKFQVGSIDMPEDHKLLTIEGLVDIDEERLFLLQTSGEIQANYQVQYSMGNTIYVNSFNQRLVPLNMPGVCVLSQCNSDTDTSDPEFVKFYKKHNIVSSTKPIRLTYAGLIFSGFLTGLALGNMDKEGFRGFTFTVSFLGYLENLTESST